MRNKAIFYHRKGYNCSQCILKAAEYKFNIPITMQSLNSCSAINGGFGIGGICSVLVAGVMIFGIMFDENTAKRLRIILLEEFHSKFKSFNCANLTKDMSCDDDCSDIIGWAAQTIEDLIICEQSCR